MARGGNARIAEISFNRFVFSLSVFFKPNVWLRYAYDPRNNSSTEYNGKRLGYASQLRLSRLRGIDCLDNRLFYSQSHSN